MTVVPTVDDGQGPPDSRVAHRHSSLCQARLTDPNFSTLSHLRRARGRTPLPRRRSFQRRRKMLRQALQPIGGGDLAKVASATVPGLCPLEVARKAAKTGARKKAGVKGHPEPQRCGAVSRICGAFIKQTR